MLVKLKKLPVGIAVGSCLLAATAAPVLADAHMQQRVEMLEKELAELKMAMKKGSMPKVVEAKKSDDGFKMGGYIKMDVRHVNGDVAYNDYWQGLAAAGDDSSTTFNARETRINAKWTKGAITGFVEMDFYGGNGNEIFTNSMNPRLRHAFIKYGKWMVGQYWSTLTPLTAFPEALDFGGAINAEVFVRQPQIRYTHGDFSIALESPETWGDGDTGAGTSGLGINRGGADPDEDIPDLIATYNFKGDWGNVQVGGLVRKVDQGGLDETALAINVGGRIKVGAKDDFRFQVNAGEPGRYVGVGSAIFDIYDSDDDGVADEVQETTAFTGAFRHFWNDDWRSTIYYGYSEADDTGREIGHFGVNLIRQIAPGLTFGVEYGNYDFQASSGADSIDSDYLQASWKMAL